MTMRVDRFVVSLALGCLCSCATTKPDSTDSPSSLIELPEQQKKQNEDKLTIEEGDSEVGKTASETGSQHKPDPDVLPLDQSPTTVSELSGPGEDKGEDSLVSDQLKGDEKRSTPSDPPPLSTTTEPNETTLPVATQIDASNLAAEGKHFFDSEHATNTDDIEDDKDKSLAGNSIDESDISLSDIFIKDSSEDLDALEVAQAEENPSEPSKTTDHATLDHADLEFSGSREDPENKTPSPDATVGLSADGNLPPVEPDNAENSLAFESENQPESPSANSPVSNLGFSAPNFESPDLEGVNSTSLSFSEPQTNEANLPSDKSTSIHLAPQKDALLKGSIKRARRYVGLSEWLSRSSSDTSSRDEVYLGHSDPKSPVELESYIDDGPLVGIEEPVPWEYDSIAKLLRPRGGGPSASSDEIGFDYESVRKFFDRKDSIGTNETNVVSPVPASRYDGVLHWLDRRGSDPTPVKTKIPVARKYSNALNWIRNEGR